MKSFDNEPRVLFEDNHLLVVLKPQGWLSQKDIGSALPDLETWAERYRRATEGKPGRAFVRACHRLDTPVTGIVCLAKTSKALERMQEAQRKGLWCKRYLALVTPAPRQREADLVHWLLQREGRAVIATPSMFGAKQARLHYRTLAIQKDTAALMIELFTGRYHQIRAQLASIGCPILGDLKYGSRAPPWHEGIALHAIGLEIPHPTKGNWLCLRDIPAWAPPQTAIWMDRTQRPKDALPIWS